MRVTSVELRKVSFPKAQCWIIHRCSKLGSLGCLCWASLMRTLQTCQDKRLVPCRRKRSSDCRWDRRSRRRRRHRVRQQVVQDQGGPFQVIERRLQENVSRRSLEATIDRRNWWQRSPTKGHRWTRSASSTRGTFSLFIPNLHRNVFATMIPWLAAPLLR